MSKIYKLKSWFGMAEAAERLSNSLGEAVSVSDLIQLGLERKLTLSVLFHDGVEIVSGVIKTNSLRERFQFPIGMLEELGLSSDNLDVQENYFSSTKNTATGSGIFNLPMIGGERADVESIFCKITGRNREYTSSLDGVFLERNSQLYRIQERFDYIYEQCDVGVGRKIRDKYIKDKYYSSLYDESIFFPAGNLPDNCEIIITRESLTEFEIALEDDNSRIVDSNSLLVLGAMLSILKNCEPKSKRWTQDSIKSELVDLKIGVGARKIDECFSEANKFFNNNKVGG